MGSPDPKLVAQAMEILRNSSHGAVIIIAVTGKDQVQCVAVSERFTDMALDTCGREGAKAVRDALEKVAVVSRQQREN